MKQIELTKGYFALVDDEDYNELCKFTWYASVERKTVYAVRTNGQKNLIRMHRQILGLTDSELVTDHIDHNGLNNQKSNLRSCTRSENSLNKNSHVGSRSKYIGVHYFGLPGRKKQWRCSIKYNGKQKTIGYFYSEAQAAIARDEYIIKNGIDFAKLNLLNR